MSLSDRLRHARDNTPPPYRARPRLLLLPRVPKPTATACCTRWGSSAPRPTRGRSPTGVTGA